MCFWGLQKNRPELEQKKTQKIWPVYQQIYTYEIFFFHQYFLKIIRLRMIVAFLQIRSRTCLDRGVADYQGQKSNTGRSKI